MESINLPTGLICKSNFTEWLPFFSLLLINTDYPFNLNCFSLRIDKYKIFIASSSSVYTYTTRISTVPLLLFDLFPQTFRFWIIIFLFQTEKTPFSIPDAIPTPILLNKFVSYKFIILFHSKGIIFCINRSVVVVVVSMFSRWKLSNHSIFSKVTVLINEEKRGRRTRSHPRIPIFSSIVKIASSLFLCVWLNNLIIINKFYLLLAAHCNNPIGDRYYIKIKIKENA